MVVALLLGATAAVVAARGQGTATTQRVPPAPTTGGDGGTLPQGGLSTSTPTTPPLAPSTPAPSTTTDTVPATPAVPAAPATPDAERATRNQARTDFASPTARDLTPKKKKAEKKRSCAARNRLPTSDMLGLQRSAVVGSHGRSLPVMVIGGVIVLAAFAWLLWRFRDHWRTGERKGLLDIAGAFIAICAGVAALAAQFIPGVGVHDDPPPELTMAVTQVHARVRHQSYVDVMSETRRKGFDPLEIGNIVWLQMGVKGYKDKKLSLQWAEYNLDSGGALLRDTADHRPLDPTHDTEIRFEPVWVGYPRSGRFQVQLRVLDDAGRVIGMARTGEMRGTQYRFACPR
jgi:hypothetical protein